jgi:hypothetical protein
LNVTEIGPEWHVKKVGLNDWPECGTSNHFDKIQWKSILGNLHDSRSDSWFTFSWYFDLCSRFISTVLPKGSFDKNGMLEFEQKSKFIASTFYLLYIKSFRVRFKLNIHLILNSFLLLDNNLWRSTVTEIAIFQKCRIKNCRSAKSWTLCGAWTQK